ncbi:MAG: excinuclease ABC subunit A, partial [Acidobacteria bacterium]
AFDTIFAEGQRRYLESLSSYARQFLGQMDKPDVDHIDGLSPAIAIDQKSASHNPRSTVGTVTEIHDYLRLLYAKIGRPHCGICGREISRLTTEEIAEKVLDLFGKKSQKVEILAPVVRDRKGEFTGLLEDLFKKGYSTAYINDKEKRLIDWQKVKLARYKKHQIDLLVDKMTVNADNITRLFEAIENSLKLGLGLIKIRPLEKRSPKKSQTILFNQQLACPEHPEEFPPLEPRLFSFNSPYGACPDCEGLGHKQEIDENLVLPDKNKTIAGGGLLPWSYKRNNHYGGIFRAVCKKYGISENKRLKDLSADELKILLHGAKDDYDNTLMVRYHFKSGSGYYKMKWHGVLHNLKQRYQKTDSEAMRKEVEKYMSKKPCATCHGSRYKKEVLRVTLGQKKDLKVKKGKLQLEKNSLNLAELSDFSIKECLAWLEKLSLDANEKIIAERALREVKNRLTFLINVGLDYLTLARTATTLSGGEAQRIRLASQIGSGLTGVLYILDEPSIGLHARDNSRLLQALLDLKNLGNTVIVIEHDQETMEKAEHLVDIGPRAGVHGGKIVHSGSYAAILKNKKSLTAQYLNGKKEIAVPRMRRKFNKNKTMIVKNATTHNLKNITVEFPTRALTCVTGVSGSGKSSLVEDTLYKWVANRLGSNLGGVGQVKEVAGYHHINKVIMVDQSPIGRTPRSNPATYTGAFTPIRTLFAATPEARARGYLPGRFSFNVPGGRCENCKGDGYLKVEMQFMADVYLPCDLCHEKRYNSETLKVFYKNKSVAEVLDMTVDQGVEFFKNQPAIFAKLKTLQEVGLGYIKLGQAATTLSGGEAQRIKLADELAKRQTGNTLYILDEPTTGLHFDDVKKLINVLHRLVDAGNTVVIIEHNLDVIKNADWIIDLGPAGGAGGGRVVATGTPEDISCYQESETGKYLRKHI